MVRVTFVQFFLLFLFSFHYGGRDLTLPCIFNIIEWYGIFFYLREKITVRVNTIIII